MRTAASALPGALLLLLPKCPFCLAVWLGLPVAMHLRGLILFLWIVIAALIFRRRIIRPAVKGAADRGCPCLQADRDRCRG